MIDSKALEAAAEALEALDSTAVGWANTRDSWRQMRRGQAQAVIRAFIAATSPAAEIAGNRADANLTIGQTGVTQEGVEYVVVPKEPTEAMLKACHESRPENAKNEATRDAATRLRDSARRIRAMDYRAMTSPSALSANSEPTHDEG